MRSSEAPSIFAASDSSAAPHQNWRSRKMKNGAPKNAPIVSGRIVFTQPSFVK